MVDHAHQALVRRGDHHGVHPVINHGVNLRHRLAPQRGATLRVRLHVRHEHPLPQLPRHPVDPGHD